MSQLRGESAGGRKVRYRVQYLTLDSLASWAREIPREDDASKIKADSRHKGVLLHGDVRRRPAGDGG